MFLLCHICISEWIHTLYLHECQGTPHSKHARYLKFKWLQRDSNRQPLSSQTKTQPFGQTDQMTELSCEMSSSCHVCISEWIHTLHLRECQGTSCSKQARYLTKLAELSGCGFKSRCSPKSLDIRRTTYRFLSNKKNH